MSSDYPPNYPPQGIASVISTDSRQIIRILEEQLHVLTEIRQELRNANARNEPQPTSRSPQQKPTGSKPRR